MNTKIMAMLVFAAALLAGCATGLRQDAAPDMKEDALLLLPVTDRALFTATGVTFAALSSTGANHLLTVDKWPQPIPANDGRGKRFYGAFVLPPGEYKFVSWALNRTEGGGASPPKEPLSFTLKKGEVTYLGNFNAIRPLAVGQFRDRFDADMREYKSIYPWMKDLNVKHDKMQSTWWPLPDGNAPD